MKKLCLLGMVAWMVGAVSADVIYYTFETSENISGTGEAGDSYLYTNADENTFAGVTVGDFTMTDRDNTESYSRFVNLGGSSVEAALADAGSSLTASFTVTIDDTVTVDLSNITFDTSFLSTLTTSTDFDWAFSTVVGGTTNNATTGGFTHNGETNYQSPVGASGDVALTGLTGLTDTTVTFTWVLNGSKNNLFSKLAMGLDDIVLTGTSTTIPEPATIGMLGLGAIITLLIRRHLRS
jgi:hypothetical protein